MNNTTPLSATEYDANIENTIPFYYEFYRQTIDLIKSFKIHEGKWLDTGCGTGTLVSEALKAFECFQFVLCDPSEAMIMQSKLKLSQNNKIIDFHICGSQEMQFINEFNIITAIQSHHYMKHNERVTAIKNCYEALKTNGAFIFFENFAPNSIQSKRIVMDRWGYYQKTHGKSEAEVISHQQRYGKSYFPILLTQHFKLLSDAGFKTVDLFWLSYMQVGIYAIK